MPVVLLGRELVVPLNLWVCALGPVILDAPMNRRPNHVPPYVTCFGARTNGDSG